MTNLIFTEMELSGSFLIELEQFQDNRGFFARSWCQREFAAQGLKSEFVQANISYNHSQGTLRGLHYQRPPSSEAKLVRCSKGAIYDVIIDLRPDSGTYLQWSGIELTADELSDTLRSGTIRSWFSDFRGSYRSQLFSIKFL